MIIYCVLVASKKHCLVDDRSLSVFPHKSIFPLYHVMLVGKDDDPSRCSLLAFLPANQVAPSPNAGLSLAGSPPRTPGSLYSTVRAYTALYCVGFLLYCTVALRLIATFAHHCNKSCGSEGLWCGGTLRGECLKLLQTSLHCIALHCSSLLCTALPSFALLTLLCTAKHLLRSTFVFLLLSPNCQISPIQFIQGVDQ